ncbi:hypothetical protein [Paludisphaera soli]|uniref:hypothetical protein n=1 Tax=Paludisphaera soli TaxID=2712865 RepID=UPI0013EB0B7F|nr:hypothetical protein [Paludisphaera soli]
MTPTLRDESEALRIALKVGLLGVDAAVAWADARILAAERPHPLLCEIALAGGDHPSDVARLLARLPGEPDRAVAEGLVAILMNDLLKLAKVPAARIGDSLILAVHRGWLTARPLKQAASWEPNSRDLDDVGPDGAPSDAAIGRMSRSFSGGLSRRLAKAAASAPADWTARPWIDGGTPT